MQCEAFEEFQAMEQYGFIYIFKCFTLAVALRMIWDKKKKYLVIYWIGDCEGLRISDMFLFLEFSN